MPRNHLALCCLATALLAPSLAVAAPREDPWEPFNRRMFAIQMGLDKALIRPVALALAQAAPGPVMTGITNFLHNLNEPVVFANDLLQLKIKRAAKTAARFAMNSSFGIGGLVDVAARNHLPRHENGFGDTLGHYHVTPGPYLFLPLVGPSDFRDLGGSVVDAGMSPTTWIRYDGREVVAESVWVVGGLIERANAEPDLQAVLSTATDPYATLRSLYLQKRRSDIAATFGQSLELPDFDTGPTDVQPPASTDPTAAGPEAPAADQPAASQPPPQPPGAAGAQPPPTPGPKPDKVPAERPPEPSTPPAIQQPH